MNTKKLVIGTYRTSFDDAVLNYMRSSGDFSSTAVLLWEYLCSLVKFKNDRQVQIFRAQLAAMIHRSEPTVTRLVRELVKKGFLIRTVNYKENCKGVLSKIKTANTYQVCLPEQIYNKIVERDNKRDRKIIKSPEDRREGVNKKPVNSNPAKFSGALAQTKLNTAADSCQPGKNDQCINIKKANINTKNNSQTKFDITTHNLKPADVPTNFVVDFEKIETKLAANRVKMDLLERKKTIANSRLAASQETLTRSQALEEYTTLDSTQIRLAAENQALDCRLRQLKIQKLFQDDLSWIAKMEGTRPVGEELCDYLKQKLVEFGHNLSSPNGCSRFNEIVWSSRFGDMAINNITGKENSMLRAFNCCLKLVRESNWETPTGFMSFITRRTNLNDRGSCYAG